MNFKFLRLEIAKQFFGFISMRFKNGKDNAGHELGVQLFSNKVVLDDFPDFFRQNLCAFKV